VLIECKPALEVITREDTPRTFFYVDPPYLHSTRATLDHFSFELSEEDHVALAKVLRACKGNVCLSAYPSDLYERLYDGWRVVTFDMPNHMAGGKTKRRETECLWMNYEHDR
jgi:DNA adenine methylase